MIKYPGPLARASVLKVPGGFLFNNLKTINSPGNIHFESTALMYLKFFGQPATFAKADLEPPISTNTDAWDDPKAFIEEGLFRVVGRYDLYVAWRELRGRVPRDVTLLPIQISAGVQHIAEDTSNLPDSSGDPTTGWQEYDTPNSTRYFTRRQSYVRTAEHEQIPSANGNPVRAACIIDRAEFGQYLLVCCFVDESTDEFHYINFEDIIAGTWESAGTINYPSLHADMSTDDPRPGRASFNASGTKMVTACSIEPSVFGDLKNVPLKVVLVSISHGIQDNTPDPPTATFSVTAALDNTHTFFLTQVTDDLTTITTTGDDQAGTRARVGTSSTIDTYKILADVGFYVDSLEYIWVEGTRTRTGDLTGFLEWFDPNDPGGALDPEETESTSTTAITNFKVFSSLWEKHHKLVNTYAGSADDGTEGYLLDKTIQETSTTGLIFPPSNDDFLSSDSGDFACSLFAAPCIEYACARTGVVVVDYSFYRMDFSAFRHTVSQQPNGNYSFGVRYAYNSDTVNHINRFISRPTPPNYIPRQTSTSDKIAVPITSDLSTDELFPIDEIEHVVITALTFSESNQKTLAKPLIPDPVVPGVVLDPVQITLNDKDAYNLIDRVITSKTSLDAQQRFRNFKIHRSHLADTNLGNDGTTNPTDYQEGKLEDDTSKGFEPVYCPDDAYGNVLCIVKHGTSDLVSGGDPETWDASTGQRLFLNGVEQTDSFLTPYLADRLYDNITEPPSSTVPGQHLSFLSNPVGFLHSIKRYV